MNNSYITIIKEKRTVLSRKRVPPNQNECTADFRIGVPFEQNLHPLEFKLLKLLSLNPNTVLTRQHLLYSLWDRNGNYVEETSLNSMICRIRQRIDTENHHYIKTIYGIGYMWSTY